MKSLHSLGKVKASSGDEGNLLIYTVRGSFAHKIWKARDTQN